MNVDWTVEAVSGVALVTVELHNDAPVDRLVRVENELAGPVLPPRRSGVPEQGWESDGFAGVVPANDRLALGYACPAPVERPPVTVTDEGRADGREPDQSPEAAVRALGDPTPPADAVPLPNVTEASVAASAIAMDEERPADETPPDEERPTDETTADEERPTDETTADEERPTERDDETPSIPPERDASADLPESVDSWFESIDRRAEWGERLTDASVVEAAAVLTEVGGLDAVVALPETLTADAETLRTVAARADRLADRIEETDVPVEALRRLA